MAERKQQESDENQSRQRNTHWSKSAHMSKRRRDLPNLRDIIDVIAHGHEEVEEELCVTLLHLHLHRAAAFESLAATDDKC